MANDSVRPLASAAQPRPVEKRAPGVDIPGRSRAIMTTLLAIGGLTLVVGFFLDPLRTSLNLLLNSYYLLTLGLGGICFVAIHYASGASWCIAVRRVPEAIAGVLPPAVVGLLALFLFLPGLYTWRHGGLDPGSFKALWLSWPFFLGRALLYVSIWLLLTRAIVRHSRRQDVDREIRHTLINRKLSALFVAAFGFTFWLASVDWIMSLEPHWYSTLFAIYNFAGLFLSGLATIAIIAVWLRKLGPFRFVLKEAHLHDLGKLIFAFSTFWMYIWFSQYMLIWYANISEETIYFVRRSEGFWMPLFLLTMVLNWAIPFLVLLPSKTKVDPVRMVQVSAVILVGHWVDLYVMIFPSFSGNQLWLGGWEIGTTCGAAGLLMWAIFRSLQAASPVPVGDPMLPESLSPSH